MVKHTQTNHWLLEIFSDIKEIFVLDKNIKARCRKTTADYIFQVNPRILKTAKWKSAEELFWVCLTILWGWRLKT